MSTDSYNDYGLKVIDPLDGVEVFNAKYPIFGSDVTNITPQIVTLRITVMDTSGKFSEPDTPTINWINDGNWHTMTYNQLTTSNYVIGSIPHGQVKGPPFMTVGKAHINHSMKVRYWHKDQDGTITYNATYNASSPSSGYYEYEMTPALKGCPAFTANHIGISSDLFTFTGVGPYVDPIYGYIYSNNITCYADDTNIYVIANLYQYLYHQRIRGSFGWDRYEKYWSDFTGSWYDFTFYILPYDNDNNIFIS